MTCTYVSVYLWTFQGEVHDFSEEVQKISEEVQNNLRGSAHCTPPHTSPENPALLLTYD
jgi:hypothetical protein